MEIYFYNDRPAPEVPAQPEVDLHHWRVLQRGTGSLHIAAQLDSGSLRVTSPLLAVDLPRGILRTESGRSYRLCEPPEKDPLLHLLMVMNASRDLVTVSGDVSERIWAAITDGAWPGADTIMLPSMQ